MRRIALLLVLGLVAACGGDGGGSERRPVSRALVAGTPQPEAGLPQPPPPPSEPTLALNLQPPGDPRVAAAYLRRLREVGVRHVRVSWWPWSTARSWDWLPAYREAGIEVLPLVYGTPGAHPDSVGRSIAARYRALHDAYGGFSHVQLDNEADGGGPFAVTPGTDPYEQGLRWGRQMRQAAESIRAFDEDVRFVTSGVAWVHPGVQEWVRGMLAAGCCEVLAMHVYGAHVWGEPLGRYREVRAVGWDGPIWATEWGVPDASGVYMGRDPDEWQLENWRRVLTQDESRFGYERLYGFQLPPDGHGYGILRPDLTPRPAFLWLREWRRSDPSPRGAPGP